MINYLPAGKHDPGEAEDVWLNELPDDMLTQLEQAVAAELERRKP
jgi:hypothetical protein